MVVLIVVVVFVCVNERSQRDVMSCEVLRCVVVRVWRRVLQRGEVCCGVVLFCTALRWGGERDAMQCDALVLARGACVHLNFVALGILQHCAPLSMFYREV